MSVLPLRHGFLKTLGIKQWYSKFALPGAAETPSALFRQEVLSDDVERKDGLGHADVDASIQQPEINSGKDLLKSILSSEDGGAADEGVEDNADLVKAEDGVVSDLGISSIELSLSRFGSVLIFNELSQSGNDVLEGRLQLNILNCFKNIEAGSLDFNAVIKWPVFESKELLNTQLVFFESIIKRWVSDVKWGGVTHVFYFGKQYENLERIILDAQLEMGADSLVIPFGSSLSEVISSPLKKKSLWSLFARIGVAGD